MKKLLFLILIFSFKIGNSQIEDKLFLTNHLRISAGFNSANKTQNLILNEVDIFSDVDFSKFSHIGNHLEVKFIGNLNKHFSINSGVKILRQKYSIRFAGDWYDFIENDFLIMRLISLNIPISVSYNTFYDNGFLDISGGLNFSFEANKSPSANSFLTNSNNQTSDIQIITNNNFDSKSVDFLLEIGYNIPYENNNILRIGLFYQNQLNNPKISEISLFDNNLAKNVYQIELKSKAFFGVNISYSFSFLKKIENYYSKENKIIQ